MSQGYQFRNMEDILVRARTSMGLVKRRSGWAYYKDFQKLRKQQHELGITNTFEYIGAGWNFCRTHDAGVDEGVLL